MKPRTLYSRLLGYLRPYVWPHFVLGFACMLLFSASNGAMPFLVRHIFDDVFTSKDEFMLQLLPAVIIGVFVLRGLASFGSTYLTEFVGQRIVADLRGELNDHIQRMSLSFFNRTPTGTIVSRVTNDVALLRNALTDAVASILKDRGQVSMGNVTALLQETIQGNRVVKAFGMEAYEGKRFGTENNRLFRLYMKSTRIRALTNPILEILAAFGIAGVVWYGGYSVINGGRTQGSFLAFLTAVFLLYDPFKRLARANTYIQQALGAAERVVEVLDTESDVVDSPNARSLDGVGTGIRFEKVRFRYEHEPVLQDVDIDIPRGQVVALVGRSGGGKSTLADLLPRFYDPEAGRITIDGVDIRKFTLASLRQHIAVVTQHTFLFNDTVRNNIAYGDISRGTDAIVAAARAAHAHEFVTELSEGYDTVIGELGVKLSGGQRQRLAIARALLKDAPILILDEATSALDTESERLVQSALQTLMRNRTTLVIAHRLSTIRRADRIVVLVRGRVVEQGTHDELVARGGEYRKLYDLQFHDGAARQGEDGEAASV
jgi:subfamily B ATP-binding cassette protein MsbA